MKRQVVVVTEKEYGKAKEIFTAVADLDIISAPKAEKELAKMVKNREAFAVIVGVDKYSGPLYEALPAGGVISRFGVGYDGINLEKTGKKRIFVTNTPGILEESVAEQAVFLSGALLRKITILDSGMRQGKWDVIMGNELRDKIWLIIGLGAIGKRVSQIVSFGFGARVLACETKDCDYKEVKERFGVEKVSPDYLEFAPEADIISLHLPINNETRYFLNYQRLNILKPTAILINNARGSLVDESALYDVLVNRKLAGAALDVYQNEPYRPVSPDKDLRRLSNLIFSPHNASSTVEACRMMAERCLKNIRCSLKRETDKMDLVPVIAGRNKKDRK